MNAKEKRDLAKKVLQDRHERIGEHFGKLLNISPSTSLQKVILRLGQAMNAKETKFFQKDGKVIEIQNVIAHNIRLDAAKFLAQLYDLLPARKIDAKHNIDQSLVDAYLEKMAQSNGKHGN